MTAMDSSAFACCHPFHFITREIVFREWQILQREKFKDRPNRLSFERVLSQHVVRPCAVSNCY